MGDFLKDYYIIRVTTPSKHTYQSVVKRKELSRSSFPIHEVLASKIAAELKRCKDFEDALDGNYLGGKK